MITLSHAIFGQVCRREGKELLSFIERLAGTAKLKAETEEVQIALDDLREQALGLEADVQTSLRTRKQLQPQAGIRCEPRYSIQSWELARWFNAFLSVLHILRLYALYTLVIFLAQMYGAEKTFCGLLLPRCLQPGLHKTLAAHAFLTVLDPGNVLLRRIKLVCAWRKDEVSGRSPLLLS